MKKMIAVATLSMMLVMSTACTKQQSGAGVGGVLGGLLGSQVGHGRGRTAAIIVGTVAGAVIGGSIGKSMDDTDRMNSQRAFENNRSNQASSWNNPDTGNQYTVTPTRTYTADSGQACREYTTTSVIDGRTEEVHGTACRQSDGSWRATN